jgi:hypothetical protein
MFFDESNESFKIERNGTPITEATFKRQGWEKFMENDDDEELIYWILPLPKDNPDGHLFCLISSINLDYDDVGVENGEYVVEMNSYGALGYCDTEEEIEVLYKALTGEDIYEDK